MPRHLIISLYQGNQEGTDLKLLFRIKVLDLQDQQEDCVADRADGRTQGAQQDLPALPAHVLAPGRTDGQPVQHVYQCVCKLPL